MSEYIDREEYCEKHCRCSNEYCYRVSCPIWKAPAADVASVLHGRWIEHEETQDDAYSHHKCSECNVNAPFDYKMREDWDEGMDGEWYSLGLVDDGINEYLTDYCPNCGARMDGDDDG